MRAIAWRLFAARLWDPRLAEAAAAPAPSRSAYGSLGEWGEAQRARVQAREALDLVTEALWPEGD